MVSTFRKSRLFTPGQTSNSSNLRPDIQALRALAVLAVVVFHIWPSRLTGGFMGVDVFFVISGYLMTLTLLKGARTVAQAASLKAAVLYLLNFYARRIKRLAPAASITLLAVLAAVFLLGRFAIMQQTASQVLSSALFIENWHLAGEAVDYWAQNNPATAVQHFWSLSIEEQFYLIWPLLLLITVLLGTVIYHKAIGKTGSLIGQNLPLVIITLFTCLSFAYSYYMTSANPSAAYFVTPARIWELSMGGIIVFLPALKHNILKLLLPWLGIALCLCAIITMNEANFPGWHALLPTVGTALAIYAAGTSRYSFNNLARFKPAQFFGNISYSLYLWHWPLIILVPLFMRQDLDSLMKFVILLASIVLATLSYKFIETPFRKMK